MYCFYFYEILLIKNKEVKTEQKNENTIIINTTNLENCRAGLEKKLYGINGTIKTKLLKKLDKFLNNLKDYNGKEIIKKEDGLDIDFYLCDLNEYIDGLNKDKKLTNSLLFGVIKSVIEDFREEYYKTIGIDISEEKEEDVSVNRIRYFDKYLNGEKDRMEDIYKRVSYVVFYGKSSTTFNITKKLELFNEVLNIYLNKMNIGKKTKEQQEVYFEEDEESLKSKSSSSEDYTSAIENMEEVVDNKTNSRSNSPVNSF